MNVYDIITERIIKQLELGQIPWRKPWASGAEMPKNLNTMREYRGINVFMLGMAGYPSPYWITLKQADKLGGKVRKGEKGMPVVFWKWREEVDSVTGDKEEIPMIRYYTVFNVAQIDGLKNVPAIENTRPFTPIESAEKILAGMPLPPTIKHGEGRAYYRPSTDSINLPVKGLFLSDEEYYATLFHELTHSTGHDTRLGRHKKDEADCNFGSAAYAREELVAEMGNAFLCAHSGIENKTVENSAAYIQGWLKVLRGNSKLVITAAAQAHKAADYILGKKPKQKEVK